MIAAIADAHSLEAAGDKILRPLRDGTLADADHPYDGMIALDGNLTLALLSALAISPLTARADLRVAPASPGKAARLAPFIAAGHGTLYVNLEEAGLLCDARFDTATQGARALLDKGAARVLVTNGGEDAAEGTGADVISATPPQVQVTRITGAGDTFMAAHIAAESKGASRPDALTQALEAAATYVSGDPNS